MDWLEEKMETVIYDYKALHAEQSDETYMLGRRTEHLEDENFGTELKYSYVTEGGAIIQTSGWRKEFAVKRSKKLEDDEKEVPPLVEAVSWAKVIVIRCSSIAKAKQALIRVDIAKSKEEEWIAMPRASAYTYPVVRIQEPRELRMRRASIRTCSKAFVTLHEHGELSKMKEKTLKVEGGH